MKIPFHRPLYDQQDEQSLLNSLRSGKIVGDGDQTARASARLAELLKVPHVLLTPSCSHALELAMLTLRLQPGDEVIVPSFTFVSSTNCILRAGGKVVFVDIMPETLTLDPKDVARKITPRTRAIMPVVYAGVSADMDGLLKVVDGRKIEIVEDAAQGLGSTYKGRPVGTIAGMSCFSFHETKNISTGEGGAFVTTSSQHMTLAEILREKGTNRKQFLQGLVDKYTWVDVGSSYLPPDFTGALLCSQLDKMEMIRSRRAAIHERYMKELAPLRDKGLIALPTIPANVESNHHIFWLLFRDEAVRNRALAFFRERGIGTTFHYLPLHLSGVGRTLGGAPGDCPVTESVSGRLLRLPIYPSLTTDEQSAVIAALFEFARA
ncbi:MAG TPA: dTDP-4-amino-4,6-dideoxygalactose transaminase [Verrucomicrobiae bacterium]|nr:dTDP-4-amino-4,6-dideoxygalactose transaminase [Verrucomicrobiae bacterium]